MNLFENRPTETEEERKDRVWGVVGAITKAMLGTKPKELPTETCPCCQAKLVRYRHSLSQALLTGLFRLQESGGEANLKDLGLTRNQWDNFQKLRYWGLVRQVKILGVRKQGVWAITETGRNWLSGKWTVPKTAVTFRGTTTHYEGEHISPNDVDPHYKHRIDYATEAITPQEENL